MKLKEIGERNAIRMIRDILPPVPFCLEDDCAVIGLNGDYILVTTDMITEKTHIPEKAEPWQVGWYLIAINLSDLASKGGTPLGLLTAIGMPGDLDESYLKELIKGMRDCAGAFDTKIIGGDTKSHEHLTITGTAIGIVSKEHFMPRRGALPGQVVAVTGSLGKASSGYYSMLNNLELNSEKELLEPKPRVREGIALGRSGRVKACMDISDGLACSLYQLAEINKVGFEIDFDLLPKAEDSFIINKECNVLLEDLIVYSGGDYELLLTFNESDKDIIESSLKKVDGKITVIGRVVKSGMNLITGGSEKPLRNRGWEHFVHERM